MFPQALKLCTSAFLMVYFDCYLACLMEMFILLYFPKPWFVSLADYAFTDHLPALSDLATIEIQEYYRQSDLDALKAAYMAPYLFHHPSKFDQKLPMESIVT